MPPQAHAARIGRSQDSSAIPKISFNALPLVFEAPHERGDVKFLAHGQDSTLYLTATDAILVAGSTPHTGPLPASRAAHSATLRFHLLGANARTLATGLDRQTGVANYISDADPRAWRTGIATYGRVAYHEVYRGIDLIYYGTQGHLEYDFRLASGANSGDIRLAISGGDGLRIDARGNLVVRSGIGNLVEARPVVYQQFGGKRHAVAGRYVLLGAHEAGFALGAYDARKPVVIDPVLSYSNLFGYNDTASGIALDRAGNAYIVGTTYTSIITDTQMLQAAPAGMPNAFVAKISPRGNKLIYSTYLGGSSDANGTPEGNPNEYVGHTYGTGIAVDNGGSAYITGYSDATNFPTTPHAFQTQNRGGYDVFVAKLSSNGEALLYSTLLGGSTDNANHWGDDTAAGIAVDRGGNAYVTGATYSYNFPLKHALQGSLGYGKGTLGSQVDAFVTKINPQGSDLVYSTYLGGSLSDYATGIALDPQGNAYVTGETNSPDFPTPPHALQAHLFGTDYNSFVAKLNRNGTSLVYSTYLGRTAADKTHGIAVDTVGNAYVVGETNGGIPRTIGVPQPTSGGGIDAFVAKLSARGVLTYSTYLGGIGDDIGYGIALDGRGNAYVTGSTGSATFNTPVFPLKGALQGVLGGNRGGFGMIDAFVAKVNSCGSGLLYSSYLGGTFVDTGSAIAVDGAGNAYVAGSTQSPNFPLTRTLPGGRVYIPPAPNVFIAKISGAPEPPRGTCPLPLTLDLSAPQVSISSGIPLTVTVHTAPFARVQISLVVKNTVPPPPPPPTPTPIKGKKVKPPKVPVAPRVGDVIFRGRLKGIADAYGLYIGGLKVKFVTSVAEPGVLTVTTSASQGGASTSMPVTVGP